MPDSPTTLFPITPQPLVAGARPAPGEDPDARDARWRQRMAELCALYYQPIVQWFARVGVPGDPRDVAHDFLRHWLEGNPLAGYERGDGRFRHFLKASLRHFVVDVVRRGASARRGGGVETPWVGVPDPIIDLEGGFCLVDRLLAREVAFKSLRALESDGLQHPPAWRIEMLRRVLDRQPMPDADLAAALGISVNALCLRVSRLRQQFWAGYHAEVRRLCRGAVAAEKEFAALVEAMQEDRELIDWLNASLGDVSPG